MDVEAVTNKPTTEWRVKRSKVFTSVAVRKEKSQQSKSVSIEEGDFVNDIKAKSRPKATSKDRQVEWLEKRKISPPIILTTRVNLLENMTHQLPPLKVIAQQLIKPMMKSHMTFSSSTKSRTKSMSVASMSRKSVTTAMIVKAQDDSKMLSLLKSDEEILKKFSLCVPDLKLYLVKLMKEEETRKILSIKRWQHFPSDVTSFF